MHEKDSEENPEPLDLPDGIDMDGGGVDEEKGMMLMMRRVVMLKDLRAECLEFYNLLVHMQKQRILTETIKKAKNWMKKVLSRSHADVASRDVCTFTDFPPDREDASKEKEAGVDEDKGADKEEGDEDKTDGNDSEKISEDEEQKEAGEQSASDESDKDEADLSDHDNDDDDGLKEEESTDPVKRENAEEEKELEEKKQVGFIVSFLTFN